ncbi:MAG: hypothetical protein IKZ58_00845 [Selenomonadaceae bacterium]|nr:hypothetical protein [Selenomonadaceae bacterium]
MKNSAPNEDEENQISTEQLEDAQRNSQNDNANIDDGSGGEILSDVLEFAVDLVGSLFED